MTYDLIRERRAKGELLLGILDFRKRILPEMAPVFKSLAQRGQKPNTMFIACSDSRVVPNLFASTNPGELFTLRNVGNLIPKYAHLKQPETVHTSDSAGAALDFSVLELGVRNIIVCGHSQCGAMKAILEDYPSNKDPLKRSGYITNWLKNGVTSKQRFLQLQKSHEADIKHHFELVGGEVISLVVDPELPAQDQVAQINVVQQLEHLMTYDLIRERRAKGELLLHGWYFDIATGDVLSYSDKKQRFVLIDEEKAASLLERIDMVDLGTQPSGSVPNWVVGLRNRNQEDKREDKTKN